MHSQPREKQQPFFKPLTNVDSLKGHSSCEVSNQRQKFQNVNFMNRVRESEAPQKIAHQKELIGNGEQQLSSSYAKMYQEIDRYRKWTVQNEIEAKQKEKKIQDTVHTNESLRKSILELQLQNESLSLRLQEEMNNREEIVQRINATRELCNLLKDHSAATEGRMKKCETERTELKYLEKEHFKQFEELSEKFKQLEITVKEDHNELLNQITVERNGWLTSEKEYTEELENLKSKLQFSMDQCDEKDIEIRDIRSELRKNEEKMHDLQCIIENLQTQLQSMQGELDKKQSLLSESEEEHSKLQVHHSEMEKKLHFVNDNMEEIVAAKNLLQNEFDSCKSSYTQMVQGLEENNHSLNTILETERLRITELESKLAKTENSLEELKSARDLQIMEKSELENKIREHQDVRKQLESEKEEDWKKADNLETELSQLKIELANYMGQNLDMQTTTENLRSSVQLLKEENLKIKENSTELSHTIDSKNEKIKEMEKIMLDNSDKYCQQTSKMKQMQEELDNEKGENVHLQSKIAEKQNRLEDIKMQLEEYKVKVQDFEEELKVLSKSDTELQSKLDVSLQTEEELRSELKDLSKELEEKVQENQDLQSAQEEQQKCLDGELKSQNKKTDDLEIKLKNLKENISAKSKQVKELEKEIKTMKSKLNSETKLSERKKKEIENILEQQKILQDENQLLHTQLEQMHVDVGNEQNITKEAKIEAKEMRERHDKMTKDAEATKKKCEHQINEMMATLEKYQQENSKIVSQKEKEIDALKLQFTQAQQSSKTENQQVLSELQVELAKKKEEVDVIEKENCTLKEKVKELQKSVIDYEHTLNDKEQEILNFKTDAKSVSTTCACVQTSPISSPKRPSTIREQSIKSTAPKTPTMKKLSSECTPCINMTPKMAQSTTDTQKKTTPKTPVINKANDTNAYVSLKTPQRSILKGSNGTSAVKKRRVVFASGDSEGEFDSESSSSELMEVEIDDIEKRFKTGKKTVPLYVRPSPKSKPCNLELVDSDEENKEDKAAKVSRLQLNRKPRGPSVTKSQEHTNVLKTQNIRKTPSRPPGKFFKTSPKDRPQQSKLSKLNQKNESWFDLDSVFGFED